MIEKILQENPNRYVLFPIKYPHLYQLYQDHVAVFWQPKEITFSDDLRDWEKLADDEKHFIKMVLAFFASSDGIVMENLAVRFFNEVQVPEARNFYAFQGGMEAIHSETYSLLINTYIKDDTERNRLFNAVQNFPCVAKKAKWAEKWIADEESDFATRLVAFAAVEGIFFSGSFCAIYWIKNKGLLPGLTFSNELISRDESLHTEFAVALYEHIENKLPQDKIYELFDDALCIEKEFILDALPCNLIGMNSELMGQYLEFVSDRLIVQLGYKKKYKVENPFGFMENISLRRKTNFFEKRNAEYAKAEDQKIELLDKY